MEYFNCLMQLQLGVLLSEVLNGVTTSSSTHQPCTVPCNGHIYIYATFTCGDDWRRVKSWQIIPLPSTNYRNGSVRESWVVSDKYEGDCFGHPRDGRKGHWLHSGMKNKKSFSVPGMKVVIAWQWQSFILKPNRKWRGKYWKYSYVCQ